MNFHPGRQVDGRERSGPEVAGAIAGNIDVISGHSSVLICEEVFNVYVDRFTEAYPSKTKYK